jgi:hypothetical protein
MASTMGWRGDIGQQLMPLYSVLTISVVEHCTRNSRRFSDILPFLKCMSALFVMSFTFPYLFQSTLASASAWRLAPLATFQGTPLEDYVAWDEDFRLLDGRRAGTDDSLSDLVEAARSRLEAGTVRDVTTEIILIADGTELLRTIADVREFGIAGDYGVFSFVVQSLPVAGFPVWVAENAPEFAGDRQLDSAADIVMIQKVDPTPVSRILLDKMGDDFTLCRTSSLWNLYMRRESDLTSCDLDDR